MSVVTSERIVCEACGRAAPYRPEFAGKRIQCKCGKVIQVPSLLGLPTGESFSAPAAKIEKPAAARPEPPKVDKQVVAAAVEAAKPVVEPARTAAEPVRPPAEIPEPARPPEEAARPAAEQSPQPVAAPAPVVAASTPVAAAPAPAASVTVQAEPPKAEPVRAAARVEPVSAPTTPSIPAPARSEPAAAVAVATAPVKKAASRPAHTRAIPARTATAAPARSMTVVNAPKPLSPEESIYALRAIPDEPPPVITRRSGIMASPVARETPRKTPQVSVIFNSPTLAAPEPAPITMEMKLTTFSRPPRPAEPPAPKPKAPERLPEAQEFKREVQDRKPQTPDRKIESQDRKTESKDRKAESSKPKPRAQEKKREATGPRKKSRIARVAIILGVLVAIIALPAIGLHWWTSHQAPPKPLVGQDKDVTSKLTKEPHQEIHTWFQQDSNRVLGPWSKDEALKTADEWKKDGAKQVIAIGTHISTVAVIELPDNPTQRKGLFEWAANWNQQHDQKVWPDVGQHYLMIQLGI